MTKSVVRILIVDDFQPKLEKVMGIVIEAGVDRNNIDVSQTSSDARERMRRTKYDLLILDLALPNRPEDRPNPNGGLDLALEIFEREDYMAPTHLVAVTAYEDLSREHAGKLGARLIHVLHYDESKSGWQKQLQTFIGDIITVNRPEPQANYNVDLCVLTALAEPELRAVRDLNWNFGAARLLDHTSVYYEGEFSSGGRTFSVVAASAARMGPVPATAHATKFIERFRPRVVAMTGICAGMADRTKIGDVILADPSWDWQSGKRVRATNLSTDLPTGRPESPFDFLVDTHQLDVEPIVRTLFSQLADEKHFWSDIHNKWRGSKPDTLPRGILGPVASGSSVLADTVTINHIQQTQSRKILGVEMEVYALYFACRHASEPRPLSFALKSVCDFADVAKGDNFHDYASFTSAATLDKFVTSNMHALVKATEQRS